jgi:cardiolipin synthase
VIVDGLGSSQDCLTIARRLSAAGVEVKIYHPLPWLTGAYRWSRSRVGWMFKFFLFLLNINRRNHRKLCIVDQERAWVGSFNITRQHLPRPTGDGWRDYAVALQGGGVQALVQGFEQFWERQKPRFQRGFIRRYLSNRSVRARRLKNRFVARSVESAARRVWLVSAYFAPTARFRRALLRACRSGVDMRLLLPYYSDVAMFPGISGHYYRELLTAGARIFLYEPSVMHAKALIIDDFFILGSSNWNYRSTLHDLELDVVIKEQEPLDCLGDTIVQDCLEARELKLENLPGRSLSSRLWYLFRYWM